MSPAIPRVAAWCLIAMLLLSAGALTAQLAEVWRPLVGKTGVLEQNDCGYQFTPSGPTQVGNAMVSSVADDHVVIVERRDQEAWEYIIPLARITIRRAR